LDTRSLSTSQLLSIWELGQGETPLQRALMLLAAFCTKKTPEDLYRLPIGRRDALLLSLREQAFGPSFSGLAKCPGCGQQLETSFSSDDIRASSGASTGGTEPDLDLSVCLDDYAVHFRLPNTLDLMAICHLSDLGAATQVLLGRCILEASCKGEETPIDELPETVLEAALKLMNESDPQADIQLNLSCPECGHKWQSAFDILSYLWKEIDIWALRTLHDVHVLASAYGWSEAEILAMSNWRRQAYLELVSQ
jgi:uncharacterized protein (UPF0212 family)